MTDASGQEYVFGSAALELVQEMDWEVIQGGGSANNNDDDKDKKNGFIDGLLNIFSPADELVGSFTAFGSVWFFDEASKLYQKWVNGDEILAKAIGLHSAGNDFTPSELTDLIAESLPDINPSPNPNPGNETVIIDDIVPDIVSGFSDISDTLKKKFLFSLVIERLGINETIVIDMSDFEDLSRLSRAMLSFIWAYVLMNRTVKIVQVRKEE